MTQAFLIVEVPVRPFSLNAERSEHRFARAKRVKDLRALAKICAKQALPIWAKPFFVSVEIEVKPYAIDRRYRQDVTNCVPSYKAIQDGLIDAGIILDDTDKQVTGVTFRPHQFGRDAMVLVLTGELSRGAEAGLISKGLIDA